MVKTHLLSKPFAKDGNHTCEFCNRPATYWSQNEDGVKCLGPSIFHCRNHRQDGRIKAIDAKLDQNKINALKLELGLAK